MPVTDAEKIAQNLRKLRRFCAIFVSTPTNGNVIRLNTQLPKMRVILSGAACSVVEGSSHRISAKQQR